MRKIFFPLTLTIFALLPRFALAALADVKAEIREIVSAARITLQEPNCLKSSNDGDGDGYAPYGAVSDVYVEYDGMECPEPYISPDHDTDCDDGDAGTHPNAVETAGDGIDQDCDGIADDPYVLYDEDESRVTSASINFTLVTKHAAVALGSLKGKAATTSTYYEVEYFALKNSGTTTLLGKTALPTSRNSRHSITVDGLEPGTVYAIRVILYTKSASGSYAYLTEQGDWFYSTTDGSSRGGLEHERTRAVLRGLKELGDSESGKTGYAGSSEPHGTRYGADLNEAWCSEFYAWVTNEWLGFYDDGLDSSQELVDFFKDHDAYYASYYGTGSRSGTDDPDFADPEYVKTSAKRGDYLAEDTNGDGDIDSNHSAMFLAYDADTDQVWSLNGNADSRGGGGNYVQVRAKAFSYAASDDNGGETAYRVVGVGRLSCDLLGLDCVEFLPVEKTAFSRFSEK